ncbi:alkene reductase [Rhodovulum sp. DZ06]|uniref:alkene reductase n=1 Tax=Rhodovulum sp. DZ06 TaxID=3425126 RepID=UPI003D34FD0E
MSDPKLFTPLAVGDIQLANRVVMAPLTRNRADHATDAPTEMTATYYEQRASAGLLITEASQISPQGKGYAFTPGIYSDEQIEGWRKVADAVHARGGKIVIQLWHVGRISHNVLQPGGADPVAPSAINAHGKTFDGTAFVETPTPRALEASEIPGIVADYAQAAKNAIAAGMDGVEIHAANGYLIDQFMKTGANARTDEYGGPVENRVRFLDEVVGAVAGAIGAGRTGIRISPFSPANNIDDANPQETAEAAVAVIEKHKLAYLHMVEGSTGANRDLPPEADMDKLRGMYSGAWMVNNLYTRDMALEAVESGRADLVAFGRSYISNPDLVERLKADAPLNKANSATFYGGGAEGYIDYPALETAS